jgi:hypothetical protein
MQSGLEAMKTCSFDAFSGLIPWRLAGLMQLQLEDMERMQFRLEAMETCRFDAIWARGHRDLQV